MATWMSIARPLAATPRRVFVTSVSGTGDLSTWADAGGQSGLAAGDAICQARALAAGLPNSSGFRAWLSSSSDDAYCRVHGLGGKRSQNCGQPTLPTSAGPWLRTDGVPFGGAITDLLSPNWVVLYPLARDEVGAPVDGWLRSGTWTTGEVHASGTCLNWSSSSALERSLSGTTDQTSAGWHSSAPLPCDWPSHLICMETGPGEPLPTLSGEGRLVFVTSIYGTGELGSWPEAGTSQGVDAGDAICHSLALAASLPDPLSFKAWLVSDEKGPWSRFTHDGPFVRLDGAVVSPRLSDLRALAVRTSINVTELGTYTPGLVWVGAAGTCLIWTTTAATGGMGSAAGTSEIWTYEASQSCDFEFGRLYCFQDLPHPMFYGDGFESGDLSWWSSAVEN
jgi:hypothetical protein